MPSDTVLRFISNFGKDSLLHLLDNRIERAVRFFNETKYEIYEPLPIAQFIAVNDCYDLGIDLSERSSINRNGFFKMYGNEYYRTDSLRFAVRKMSDSLPDFNSLFFQHMKDDMTKVGFAVFCDVIPFSKNNADSAYKRSFGCPAYEKLSIYFMFTDLARNCPEYISVTQTYREDLFGRLYDKYSFKRLIGWCNKTGISAVSDKTKIYNSYVLTAYGLYANDITIDQRSDNLFYLFALQKELHGDWPAHYTSNVLVHDDYSTFYALWALVQFREKLANWQIR